MSDRKQTPNVLADLLGGEPAGAARLEAPMPLPASIAPSKPRRPRAAKPVGPGAPVRTAPARWEHRIASFQQHKGWRLRYLDGVEQPGWASGPQLSETIAELAADGWQIAAVCSGEALFGNLDKYQVYFKRPV
jgi:hypothetical protein